MEKGYSLKNNSLLIVTHKSDHNADIDTFSE